MGKTVQRGLKIDIDVWTRLAVAAARRGVNLMDLAGVLLERAVATELGAVATTPELPSFLDEWRAVPAPSRTSVREAIDSDIRNFVEQYKPGDDAGVDKHLAGLRALAVLLERAEAAR